MVARRLTIALAATVVSLLGCAIWRTGPPGKELWLEPNTWDFGTVERGEIAKGKVMLHNDTNQTFTISLYSTCDCLRASADEDLIRPHSSLAIDLSYLGDVVKARVSKTVFIEVRNRDSTQLRLNVTGTIVPGKKPHLVAVPNPLAIESSAQTGASLEISNRGKEELIIEEIRCFGCTLSATHLRLAEGEKARVEIDMLPQWQGRRWVEIESNDPVTPVRKVAIVELE